MIQSTLVKILLAPFSLLYGIGISFRNRLYHWGLLKSVEFNLPVISVGNLSVGGAGKTPHIEYLIRLLKDYINVATLSRGYKRKSKGFLEIRPQHNAETAGDEPLQFRRKFPDIMVTVSESRSFGIPEIVKRRPDTQVVLLDDAFQHLAVKPGLNILLTEFHHPFTEDFLLPSGRLREWRSAYERADVIIVSKCPFQITEEERQTAIDQIKPMAHQQIFFSYYSYDAPYYMLNPRYRLQLDKQMDVVLIAAIARTEYLVDFLETKVNSVTTLKYEDHRLFTKQDIGHLKRTFDQLDSNRKVILTTEKDAMRLEMHREFLIEHRVPIFSLPVRVAFHFDEGQNFDALVKDYMLEFKT